MLHETILEGLLCDGLSNLGIKDPKHISKELVRYWKAENILAVIPVSSDAYVLYMYKCLSPKRKQLIMDTINQLGDN